MQKISASVSYLVALACFFLPFMEISCSQMKFDVSGYTMATGTAGESISKEIERVFPWVLVVGWECQALPNPRRSSRSIASAMIVLAGSLLLGLLDSGAAVKFAIGLGVVAIGLVLLSIPTVKPEMKELVQVS